MEREITLTSNDWSDKRSGWNCPQLSSSRVKLKDVEFNGLPGEWRFLPKRFLYREVPLIKWEADRAQPDSIIITIFDLHGWARAQKLMGEWLFVLQIITVLIALVGLIPLATSWIKSKKIAYEDKSNITPIGSGNQFTDDEIIEWHDNNSIKWVTKWNVDFDKYNDSTPIMQATGKDARKIWDSCNLNGIGCWCYYNDDVGSGKAYGKLYNSYAAMDSVHGGLIPLGWRLFTTTEVETFAEKYYQRGGYLLKSKDGWRNRKDGSSGGGIDSFGFNAKAGGYCAPVFKFEGEGYETGWWTLNPSGSVFPDYRQYYSWHVRADSDSVFWFEHQRQYGFYIRCITVR